MGAKKKNHPFGWFLFLGPTLKMEPVLKPDFLLFQLFIAIFSYLLCFKLKSLDVPQQQQI